MKKIDIQKFLEANKENTETMSFPVTTDQLNMMQLWADQLGVDFEEVPMLLIHYALKGIEDNFKKMMIKNKTIRN